MSGPGLKRIVLTTGGTGGHIFPALAVAEELRLRYSGVDILFLGGSYGPEQRLVEAAGIRFKALPGRGVLGRGWRSLTAMGWVIRAMFAAIITYLKNKPQAVVGFGGYASFCPMLAALVMGIPTAIHEQNSVPGIVNRMMGRRVHKVFLSFEETSSLFDPAKTVLTGNPVRRAIADVKPGSTEQMGRRLLVFGGSQGARSINDAIIENLAEYREAGIAIRHQTGQADEERVRAAYAVAGMDEKAVAAFIDDMAGAYQEADLVLCRAGATTLAELAAAGKPSALIPFPFATHDHQTHNAMAFSSAGAGVVVMQDDMDGRKLFEIIRGLLDDPARLERMGAAASALGRPDAAARIAEGVAAIARPSREKPA